MQRPNDDLVSKDEIPWWLKYSGRGLGTFGGGRKFTSDTKILAYLLCVCYNMLGTCVVFRGFFVCSYINITFVVPVALFLGIFNMISISFSCIFAGLWQA